MTVAETILNQLGGRRFIVMTGSKNFTGSDNSLSFKVGRNPKGISHVRIELTPADLYTVSFLKFRNLEAKTVSSDEGVYAEDLQTIFTSGTGLFTRL